MEVNELHSAANAIDPCEAHAELERLLADLRLHLTDRNRAFLRYIAEQYFAGNFRGAKAYSIAIDVFGRPASFDPALDPIVRIEAARIRAALDQYYDAYAGPQQLRIRLPRGHYVAEFCYASDSAEPRQETDAEDLSAEPSAIVGEPAAKKQASRGRSFWNVTILGAAGAALLVLAALRFMSAEPVISGIPVTGKPFVRFAVTTRDAQNSEHVEDFRDALVTAVSRFGTLRISDGNGLAANRTVSPERGLGDLSSDTSDYQIAVKYKVEDTERIAAWTVTETRTGETIASGEDRAPATANSIDEADSDLVSALAARFGASLGIIGGRELSGNAARDAQGNICVLRGDFAILHAHIDELAEAATCLRATIRTDDRNSDAMATLSRVLVASDEATGSVKNSSEALILANKSVMIAPTSDRALAARMVATFAIGRPDAGLAAGKEAMAANPLNNQLAGAFALRVYLTGTWSDGLAIAERTRQISGDVSSEAEIVIALDAYRTGNYPVAMLRLDSVIGEDKLTSLIRIATLVCMGKTADASAALGDAERLDPQYYQRAGEILNARRFEPALARMLMRDLATVGPRT